MGGSQTNFTFVRGPWSLKNGLIVIKSSASNAIGCDKDYKKFIDVSSIKVISSIYFEHSKTLRDSYLDLSVVIFVQIFE
jgi:hypothetical protein